MRDRIVFFVLGALLAIIAYLAGCMGTVDKQVEVSTEQVEAAIEKYMESFGAIDYDPVGGVLRVEELIVSRGIIVQKEEGSSTAVFITVDDDKGAGIMLSGHSVSPTRNVLLLQAGPDNEGGFYSAVFFNDVDSGPWGFISNKPNKFMKD